MTLDSMQALWSLRAGQSGSIRGFADTINEAYRARLIELGFHPGETVHCVQAPGLGAPHAYRVSNTVYSLDDEVASQVLITELPGNV